MAVADTPSGYDTDEGTDNFVDDRRTTSASAFDEEEEEENDYEEDDSTPVPPKRTIKFVVANPERVSTVMPKASPRKRVSRPPRYTEPDEDDEDEIVEEDAFEEDEGTNDKEEEEEEEENEEEEERGGGDYDEDETTPDFTKMTARQRARKFDIDDGPLLELPATKKKAQLTEEEQQLRREELARRRKNMSVRRLEEEKQETLDKLLKKRASRSRKTIVDDTGNDTDGGSNTPIIGEDGKYRIAKSRLVPRHPSLLSWQSNRMGFSLSFEKEWVDLRSGKSD